MGLKRLLNVLGLAKQRVIKLNSYATGGFGLLIPLRKAIILKEEQHEDTKPNKLSPNPEKEVLRRLKVRILIRL